MELILASASPRRKELFKMIGLSFSAVASDANEDIPVLEASEYVERLAQIKAQSVKARFPGACVVGCDTIVLLDGKIIGKPRDEDDAYRILSRLSGRTHSVYTGLAVITDKTLSVEHDVTQVTFASMSADEIRSYIRTGEPMDKAGAYGIQGMGGIFVNRIDGCYFTVIGLPLPKLYRALLRVGIYPNGMAKREAALPVK